MPEPTKYGEPAVTAELEPGASRPLRRAAIRSIGTPPAVTRSVNSLNPPKNATALDELPTSLGQFACSQQLRRLL
jgi:hypothetical protein